MDAAILFSDIMTPVEGMGVTLDFAPGPVIETPIRSLAQVEALRVPDPEESVPFVLETVRLLSGELPASAPLIGFAGAPFTTFCYLVQGGGSKTFSGAKAFLFAEPEASRKLLEKLSDTMACYLEAQAAAGAKALMIFDSWAGLLGPDQYREFAFPAVRRMIDALPSPGRAAHLLSKPGGDATWDRRRVRGRRGWGRLAAAALRRPPDSGTRHRRAGQPGSNRAIRPTGRTRPSDRSSAGGRWTCARPRLQPRPWDRANDGSRCRCVPRRSRTRGVWASLIVRRRSGDCADVS